jgi:hypothetical protein
MTADHNPKPDPLFDEYHTKCNLALAEYRAKRDPLLDEYNTKCNLALAEYKARRDLENKPNVR